MKKILLSAILFFGLLGTSHVIGQTKIVNGAALAQASISANIMEVAGVASFADKKGNKISYFPITIAEVNLTNVTLLSGNCDYNVNVNKDFIVCEIINDVVVKTKFTMVVINYN
jgi:hypothetical protein